MDVMTKKANDYGRKVQFGLRVHVIVRETEKEARVYAENLLSKLDVNLGANIRNRSQDSYSLGVSRQSKLREEADEKYYVEPNLWTGIGLARSGCGAALVGNPDQIVKKLEKYMEMGIRSFILSGYPHKQECELFARHILPKIKNISLPEELERLPKTTPKSPLGAGKRV
jgi:alkanesulfonate monooxygenase